jgi:hypothetical protein
MIILKFNFSHPFEGKVSHQKLGKDYFSPIHFTFDSKGKKDFSIQLNIGDDGHYVVTLEWEYQNRLYFHQSDIRIESGMLIE